MAKLGELEGRFFNGLPFFSGLPENDINIFLKSAVVKFYKKNEHIFHQGDEADRFFIVMSGWVRMYRETVDGEEAVTTLMSGGDIFGEATIVYKHQTYIYSAQAIENSSLFEMRKSVLEERVLANPDILRRVMVSMSEKMEWLQTKNEHMFHMTTSQRVACLILRLSAHMIGNGGTFTMPYDKSIAATQLGMKRETFSRALTQLKALGVTVNGSEIRVENFSRLTQFCCSHCALSAGQCAGARCGSCVYQKPWEGMPTGIHSFRGS